MDIYGYYETDANHNQARFSRRCFFPTDSRCKIIGYPIGRGIDLRVFLSRIIDYMDRSAVQIVFMQYWSFLCKKGLTMTLDITHKLIDDRVDS